MLLLKKKTDAYCTLFNRNYCFREVAAGLLPVGLSMTLRSLVKSTLCGHGQV